MPAGNSVSAAGSVLEVRAARDLYEVLGLQRGASRDDVRRAHRRLVREYHPDANPQDPRRAEERFKEVQRAYEVLSDEEKRREYDRRLRASSSSGGEAGESRERGAAKSAAGGRRASGLDLSELLGKLKDIFGNVRSSGTSTTEYVSGGKQFEVSNDAREKRVRGPQAQSKEKRVKGPKARRRNRGG